ncbi:MAG: hypothetical protein ACYDCL_03245 [Myxococcales bacterium]
MRKLGILVAALAGTSLTACSGGNNVTYFRVAAGELIPATSNSSSCPSSGYNGPAYTFQGIDGLGTWAIYTAPGAAGGAPTYLLDDGSGNLLEGTLTSGVYAFNGQEIVDTKGTPEVTVTTKLRVQLTLAGDGFGPPSSVTQEQICVSTGTTGCDGNSSGSDCVSSFPVTGVQLSGVTQDAVVNPQAPAPNSSQMGGGNGGNNGGGGGGGSVGSCQVTSGSLNYCIDYVGSAYSSSTAQSSCTSSTGTYSSGSCAAGSCGTCTFFQGQSDQINEVCESGETSSQFQTACTASGGTPG